MYIINIINYSLLSIYKSTSDVTAWTDPKESIDTDGTVLRTTAGGGATCGGEIDGGASRAVLKSRGEEETGRADAGGTAVAATVRVRGGARLGTGSRTPIASPSCPRQQRCT